MMLQFGSGWRDRLGRQRTLLWLSDAGLVLFDDGHNVHILRRGVYDEVTLRCRLMGWQDHVDDPQGPDWVEQRLWGMEPLNPSTTCLVCQGEGWLAGPDGYPVMCSCGTLAL